MPPSLSSPWAPISAIATIALTMPIVRKVIPWGTSRNARKSFNACSLSALWDGGRDNDLCQLVSDVLPYDMPIDAYTLEVF
jgi:hypothetical protein